MAVSLKDKMMKRVKAATIAVGLLAGGSAVAGDSGADPHKTQASAGDNTELSTGGKNKASSLQDDYVPISAENRYPDPKRYSGTNAAGYSISNNSSSGDRSSVGGGDKGFKHNVNAAAFEARSQMAADKASAQKIDSLNAKELQGDIEKYNDLKTKFVAETKTIISENAEISQLKSDGNLSKVKEIRDKQIDRYDANKDAGFDYSKAHGQLYDLESKFSDAQNIALSKTHDLKLPDEKKDASLVEKGQALGDVAKVQSMLGKNFDGASLEGLMEAMGGVTKAQESTVQGTSKSHVDDVNKQRQGGSASQSQPQSKLQR